MLGSIGRKALFPKKMSVSEMLAYRLQSLIWPHGTRISFSNFKECFASAQGCVSNSNSD